MILPNSEGSLGIQCRMCTVSLDDQREVSFTAMSYTWGDPTARKDIDIDGHAFKTTDSVYEMILQREHGIWLWIDALCINQADFEERASQVRLMSRIYGSADRVVIWLGPASEDSELAMGFIQELNTKLPGLQSGDDLFEKASIEYWDPRWVAMGRLLERPWFSRLWVVQEVVLASKLLQFSCGSCLLLWTDLEFALVELQRVRALGHIKTDISHPGDHEQMLTRTMPAGCSLLGIVQNIKMIWAEETLDLTRALQYVAYFSQVTDGRDKIYGLYGIASGVDDPELTPDYNKAVEEVYIQTTRHLITTDNSLQLLVDAGTGYHNNILLPSWVPNYSFPHFPNRVAFDFPGNNFYEASGSTSPTIHWTTGSNDLTLSGVIVDSLVYTGTSTTTMTGAELREWVLEALHLVGLFNESRPETISEEDLWKTLIGDRTPNSNLAKGVGVYGALFEYFKYWCQNPQDFVGMTPGQDTKIKRIYLVALEFARASVRITTTRKFGISRNGHPGILPGTAAIGDKIAIILGLSTPYIVRECPKFEKDSGEQKYILVGECYLHHMMNGEGLKERVVENLIFQ